MSKTYMTHYCKGKWIDGTPSNCSAGLTKGMHRVLLTKEKAWLEIADD